MQGSSSEEGEGADLNKRVPVVAPGWPKVTNTPLGSSSLLSDRLKVDKNALLAEYTAAPGPGPEPATDPTNRILLGGGWGASLCLRSSMSGSSS
mmetsp:Transcript_18498/g.25573  ORF Transcript_18498/g.25573 Transcript_18498/m.25573 type:complete len:94 (-) Transcript_18498:1375-1656(-)